jgi:phenylacetate-CoA ligase
MSQTDRTTGHYHPELEVMDPEARNEYLSRRLTEIVQHAYHNAPAMRDKFDRAGVKPDDVQSPADLAALPITEKSELVELQKQNPPFGGLVAVSRDKLRRIFASPGPIYEP